MCALASAGNVGWRERAQKHKLVDQSRILMMHSKHVIVDVVDVANPNPNDDDGDDTTRPILPRSGRNPLRKAPDESR